jgi:hypothetical protein
MIRAVVVASLSALLLLVLYLPSAHAPEQFVAVLREEHVATAEAWGWRSADAILERTLRWQQVSDGWTPLPGAVATANISVDPMAGAIGQEMNAVQQRLLRNDYFRAIDALVLLATHRLAALLHWWPGLLPVVVASWIDALQRRRVRARVLAGDRPERFALWGSLCVGIACAGWLAMVWPVALPPVFWPGLAVAVAGTASRAWGWYRV